MSVEYIFYNKPLSKTELLEQTDFVIEEHNDSEWIIASPTSNLRIKSSDGDKIFELENHGFKNVDIIMDTIVEKFNITFYDDGEFENYCQLDRYIKNNKTFPYPEMLNENGEFDFKKAVYRSMKEYGNYVVLDEVKGDVIVPKRD